MADAPVVHIGENSPEYVAWKLLHEIASMERKATSAKPSGEGWQPAGRQWWLDTYAECLYTVKGFRTAWRKDRDL